MSQNKVPALLTNILDQTDSVMNAFVFQGYEALSITITPWIATLAGIMVAGFGWALLRGMIQTPVQHAINSGLKLAVVLFLAQNWSYFSQLLYELFTNGPNELTRAILDRAAHKWSLFSSTHVNGALQEGLDLGMQKATEIIRKGSIGNFSPVIIGTMAALATLLVCGFSLGLLVLAKAGLAICLILSPLFLICFLFESTKSITEKWMQHVIGFALMPIGIHCVMLLILTLMDSTLRQFNDAGSISFGMAGAYILLGIISLPLLLQVKHLMASIASGFTFNSMGAVGNTLHSSKRFISGAHRAYQRTVKAGERVGSAASNGVNNIINRIRKVA